MVPYQVAPLKDWQMSQQSKCGWLEYAGSGPCSRDADSLEVTTGVPAMLVIDICE